MTRETDGNMEQAILQAAEQLFLKKGFALTSTTEIAEVAGCNQALIHYYFRTKERLFEAIFEKKAALFFSNIIEITDSSMSFEDTLRRTIEAHFEMLRANQQLPFFLVNELTTNPSRIETLKKIVGPRIGEVYARVSRWFAEEASKGSIRPIDPFDLIYSVVTLNVGAFLAAPIVKNARGIDDSSFERYLDERREANVDLILKSLRP
jgi:TetR/AcrR family transcriptional regulator